MNRYPFVLLPLFALGCIPDTDITSEDTTSPRVISVSPGGRLVRTNESITIKFSEPMAKKTLDENRIVIARTDLVTDAFVKDLDSPPLSDSRIASLIPIAVEVKNSNQTIVLVPENDLPTASQLTAVLSKKVTDQAFNPLVGHKGLASHFRFDFVTDDGAPTVTGTDLPNTTPAEVPPNIRTISLTFDQPVYAVNRQSLTLTGTAGAQDPSILSIEQDSSRLTATLRLADSGGAGCYTLCPLQQYQLTVTADVVDVEGVAITPYSVEIHSLASADLAAPRLLDPPVALAAEDSAEIRWNTDEPSSSAVSLGDSPDNLTRWVVGAAAVNCEGLGLDRSCPHRVEIDGLDLGGGDGRTYYYVVQSLDAVANPPLLAGPYTLRTRRLPKLALNEVYVNPPGHATSEDPVQEFIEIYNYSTDVSYDLANYSLREIDDDGKLNLAPWQAGGPTLLEPGKYAVVGSPVKFDPTATGVSQDALLLTDDDRSHSTLLSYIENSDNSRNKIGLYEGDKSDTAALLVSSYGAPVALYSDGGSFTEGVSAERLTPEAADIDDNWCYSIGSPTPGSQNTVFELTSCP